MEGIAQPISRSSSFRNFTGTWIFYVLCCLWHTDREYPIPPTIVKSAGIIDTLLFQCTWTFVCIIWDRCNIV